MKAIINGFRYDTEAAELIGEADHGNRGDFDRWAAGLYKTASGRFFLAGEGGSRSRWALKSGPSETRGSASIIALTPGEAREWAAQHLSMRQVEAGFTDHIKDA